MTQSTGSSNRPWAIVDWEVSSSSSPNSASALQTLLSSFGKQTSQVIDVPGQMLEPGRYYVTLTLTNSFGSSASALSSFFVTQLFTELASILLQGPNQKVYKASQALLYTSAVKALQCNSTINPLSTHFTWRVLANNQFQPAIVSTSPNPSIFQLPSYSLLPGITYIVQVVAVLSMGNGLTLNSSNNASVIIVSGDVVAIISGGSTRLISQDTSLSCAESYDENSADLM
eukprot:gene31681-38288_t